MRLAAFAIRPGLSEGRRYPEPPHPYRSEFQRDRDRVIHSKAFRRLEKKTQVFAPDYSDHFRNRLTHTLEVTQISRTIAEALQLNVDLCEVLALSHDIGHSPFSHEGEEALDRIMRRFGSGFDHNLHALRIVEDFEEKYPGFRGLNLTFEVREGIVKHSRDYPADCVTYVDISSYRLGERPPLEAQLIDLADEIAYNTADLDDGFDSGLLSLDTMRSNLALFGMLWEQTEKKYPLAEEKLKVSEVIRRLIDTLVSDLIDETGRVLRELNIRSVEEVRIQEFRVARFSEVVQSLNGEIKGFLRSNLYDHEILRQARWDARRQVEELFEYYFERPENLPPSHLSRAGERTLEGVVCDYVAGMTDLYARAKHAEIVAPS